MSAPKLYAIVVRKDKIEKVLTFRELSDAKQDWDRRAAGDESVVYHCGFVRPRAETKFVVPEQARSRVMYSAALKWALTNEYSASSLPIAYIELDGVPTPCYLSLNQWGYTLEDQSAHTEMRVHSNTKLHGWVAIFANEDSDGYRHLLEQGVNDDPSYLAQRGNLLSAQRDSIDMRRFEILLPAVNPRDPTQLATILPHWLAMRSIADIGLSVRSENALSKRGLTLVCELANYTAVDLLAIPNMGRHSVANICDVLQAQVKKHAQARIEAPALSEERNQSFSNDSPTGQIMSLSAAAKIAKTPLISHLRRTLDALPEVDQKILQGRLGFNGTVLTLAEVAEEIGVTRERVRQRQKKQMKRIVALEYWDDLIGIRLGQLLLEREEPLILEMLEVEDSWFDGFGSNTAYLAAVIQAFSENELRVTNIDGRNVITRICQKDWGIVVKDLRSTLKQKADEGSWMRSEIAQYFASCLSEHSAPELVDLLWEIFGEYLQFQSDDPDANLVTYGKSAESAVAAVLAQAEGPLHFTEIAQRASKILGKNVEERRAHGAVIKKGVWLFDRGTYGLIDHCPLPESKRKSIRRIVEHLLYQCPINKQWHSNEILDELRSQFETVPNELDAYILRMCLEESDRISFLNRMIWARSDSGMESGDRIETTESFIQILEQAGEPLTGRELKRRLSEIRGVAENMQIHGNDRLVPVAPNVWGLSEWN